MISPKTWPRKRPRSRLVQGVAAFVLLAFVTVLFRGNWHVAAFCLGGVIGGWWLIEAGRRRTRHAALLQELEVMGDDEFCHYVANLLRTQGYGVQKVGAWASRQVDLLLSWGEGTVLCRLLRARRPVRRREVIGVLMAARARGVRHTLIVASQRYSLPARFLARGAGCVLIDQTRLAHLVAQHRQGHRVYLLRREEATGLRKRKH